MNSGDIIGRQPSSIAKNFAILKLKLFTAQRSVNVYYSPRLKINPKILYFMILYTIMKTIDPLVLSNNDKCNRVELCRLSRSEIRLESAQ